MAVDYYLKMDGIKGESRAEGHKDEIDVLSFSWGVSQAGAMATGGAGTGKAQFQDFQFSSLMSKASPQLFLACASGEHIKEATLTGEKSGGEQSRSPFVKIKLSDVLVSSYHTGGANDQMPSDAASLNYSKVEFSFATQKSDGTLDTWTTAGWDLKLNKKI